MYRTTIGHAHLCVRELRRSVAFYEKYLGLELTEIAADTAFMTGGGPHHQLALWQVGMDAGQPSERMVGLNHLAFDVPDKRSFAEAYCRLVDGGVPVDPVDHRIGWGCYFIDPDGNGLEIYCDTRQALDGDTLWRGQDRPLAREHILAVL